MNGRFDAVRKAFINWVIEVGKDSDEARKIIDGLSEEELLQRMRDAREYKAGVDELEAMKQQAELNAFLKRVATDVFTDTDDLTFLIRPKRGGSPDRRG